MKSPYNKLAKIYANWFGHMTKMADMPIYGKKPFKNVLLQNQKADDLGTWYVTFGMWGLPSLCSNDEPRLTLTYLICCQICFLMHLNLIFLEKFFF